jgi:GNAT superfamily N-acetyltransferase
MGMGEPMLRVEDLTEENLEDVFRVCSYDKLDDPLQKEGIELKRAWLREILEEHGPCTKIAYHEGRPVAQILFYPERIAPFLAYPREGAVAIHCTYNPFPEAQGKGVGSRLLQDLINECEEGLQILGGDPCSFLVAQPFTTGAGIPLEKFYENNGFKWGDGEMYLEVSGEYKPRKFTGYYPLPEDLGRAVVFYDSMCEWAHPFAIRVKELLQEMRPNLVVASIDRWKDPDEYVRRGGKQLIVNAKPIESFWTDREAFRQEVEEALLA